VDPRLDSSSCLDDMVVLIEWFADSEYLMRLFGVSLQMIGCPCGLMFPESIRIRGRFTER